MSSQPPPDTTLRPALKALAKRDQAFAQAFEVCGLPPQRGHEASYAGLLHIITAQQVSAASARAIIGRLNAACPKLSPRTFLRLDDEDLKAIGFSRQKMRYGRALAEDCLNGRIDLKGLEGMADEAAIAHLVQAKGIGRWTAEIYLLFALKRPDIWPIDDLAIVAACGRLKGHDGKPDRATMLAIGEAWRPHRSAAARFLWHYYHHPGVPEMA